jgi:hypothetical protein
MKEAAAIESWLSLFSNNKALTIVATVAENGWRREAPSSASARRYRICGVRRMAKSSGGSLSAKARRRLAGGWRKLAGEKAASSAEESYVAGEISSAKSWRLVIEPVGVAKAVISVCVSISMAERNVKAAAEIMAKAETSVMKALKRNAAEASMAATAPRLLSASLAARKRSWQCRRKRKQYNPAYGEMKMSKAGGGWRQPSAGG